MSLSFIFLATFILGLIILSRLVFFVAVVEGTSMHPNFVEGERVLVLRLWPKMWIKKGQVIITRIRRTPWILENNIKTGIDDVYIKRVTGLSGDEVITQFQDLPEFFRNRFAKAFDEDGNRIWKIPAGYYFIKSDSSGLDSTLFGPVSSKGFMGLVLGKLPLRRSKRQINE